MSRLTRIAAPPPPDPDRVWPHACRLVEGDVLLTTDTGRFVFLSPGEYRDYLGGLDDGHPREDALRRAGLLRRFQDFDKLAGEMRDAGLSRWRGPASHILRIDDPPMRLETAREVVDFIFTSPAGEIGIEIVSEGRGSPALSFIVEYAERKAEWTGRHLTLTLRSEDPPPGKTLSGLLGRGVGLRVPFRGRRPPRRVPSWLVRARAAAKLPGRPGPRAIFYSEPEASASGWVEFWRAAGFRSVSLRPGSKGGIAAFGRFYSLALDRMLGGDDRPREEWALGVLSLLPGRAAAPSHAWAPPGHDILSELAYCPRGGIYSSELGMRLAAAGAPAFRLGEARTMTFPDLGRSSQVRGLLAAAQTDLQPVCSGCAYKPYCGLPPSECFRVSGTLWRERPFSPECSARLAMLDEIFSRLKDPRRREALLSW